MTDFVLQRIDELAQYLTVGFVGSMADLFTDQGVPLLRGQNVKPYSLDLSNIKFISPDTHRKWKKSSLEAGDVVIVRVGYPGTACVVPQGLGPLNAASLVIVRPDKALLDPYYLAYVLNSPWGKATIKGRLVGAAQQVFNTTTAAETKIPAPPVAIQRRIASILSAYDALIENNTRRIAILEEMARRIYEEWFVHFRFPGHENVRMVESDLGLVPEGWPVVRLDDVLVLQRGFDLPKQDRMEGAFPIVSATGMSGSHHERRVKGPGVVTGRSGSLGTVMYVDVDYWPLNTTLWVKDFKVGSPLYAYYVLSGIDLAGFNSGAAVPTLNRNDIHGLPVTKPTEELLRRFDELAGPMIKLKQRLELSNAKLGETRDLLLPKLISGELDVSAMPEPETVAA